jgi:hypothetical protein
MTLAIPGGSQMHTAKKFADDSGWLSISNSISSSFKVTKQGDKQMFRANEQRKVLPIKALKAKSKRSKNKADYSVSFLEVVLVMIMSLAGFLMFEIYFY